MHLLVKHVKWKILKKNPTTIILVTEKYLYLKSDLCVTARWLLALSKIKPSTGILVLLPPVC